MRLTVRQRGFPECRRPKVRSQFEAREDKGGALAQKSVLEPKPQGTAFCSHVHGSRE